MQIFDEFDAALGAEVDIDEGHIRMKVRDEPTASALEDAEPTTLIPSASSNLRAAATKPALSSTIRQRTAHLPASCRHPPTERMCSHSG
jgi:hypothetical protein